MPFHTFLTLPREIRDIIYTHLTTSVSLPWLWRISIMTGYPGFPDVVQAQIMGAPMVNVLLIHPQIYDEYSRMVAYRRAALRFNLNSEDAKRGEEWTIEANKVVARWLQSTESIQVSLRIGNLKHLGSMLKDTEEFADAVRSVAPLLKTVEVVWGKDKDETLLQSQITASLKRSSSSVFSS